MKVLGIELAAKSGGDAGEFDALALQCINPKQHPCKNVSFLIRYIMADILHPIPLKFWRSKMGREPVRDWLNDFSRDD